MCWWSNRKRPPPQPITRPKDIVMRFIEKCVTSGGDTGSEQPHHAAARRRNGDGKPPTRSSSSTISIRRSASRWSATTSMSPTPTRSCAIPTMTGDTTIAAPGVTLTPLPGGPIDHHWTKSLTASPDGSLLYVGVGSNSNITENGMRGREESRGDLGSRSRDRPLAHLRERAAQSERPDLRAGERRALDRRQRARRTRPEPGA